MLIPRFKILFKSFIKFLRKLSKTCFWSVKNTTKRYVILFQGKIRKWEADQDITSETFKNMVNRCSIIFLTPKSLCNFLDNEIEHSRVDIDQFTLLVLDECHHTYGKSPYNEIMGHYRKKKFGNGQNKLPQVFHGILC